MTVVEEGHTLKLLPEKVNEALLLSNNSKLLDRT